jgi:kumamolisin
MDLEIAHAAAPDARLVVYYSDAKPADVAGAFTDAVRDHPNAIFSISLGACEAGSNVQSAAGAWNTSMQRLASTGGNAFVASGDQGAFPCGPDDNGNLVPTISSPADDPYATAVGGTTLFIGQGNTYSREAGWGLPIEQVGSGGGLSMVWKLPSYQAGPGVNNPQSTGMRQVPDVASLGDGLTGWDICTQHGTSSCWVPAAGTSSGAPLWAALTSLINESAVSHNVKRVGFPNAALYAFAQHPERFPAPAFHDITQGNNLYYQSTPAWDFVTGLGTPNAGALLDDFLAYQAGQ